VVGPAQLRKAADHLKKKFNRSERSVCRAIGLARSSCRYVSIKAPDDDLKAKMRDIAQKYRRYGYRRIYVLIRREGLKVNHKRIYRIYRAEGLKVERRKKKKMASFIRMASPLPTGPNERWSIDFVSDQFVDGRRLKIFTVVDDFSKECPLIHVDTSITGVKLVELFKELGRRRPLPATIVCDNGPEFISRDLDAWAYHRGIKLDHIRPGKPVENCFIESFNGKFREECLEENIFSGIEYAKMIIESWRKHYNRFRPHSSLGNKTPMEFMETLRGTTKSLLVQ
jgi:putative transposase